MMSIGRGCVAILLVAVWLSCAVAKPKQRLPVAELNNMNFHKEVRHGHDNNWMVMYVKDSCSMCRTIAPIFEQLGQYLLDTESTSFIGKVDCTKDDRLCKVYEVNTFPAFTFHVKGLYEHYNGEFTYDAFLAFIQGGWQLSPLLNEGKLPRWEQFLQNIDEDSMEWTGQSISVTGPIFIGFLVLMAVFFFYLLFKCDPEAEVKRVKKGN